jgi:hypothetical protein
MQPMPSPARCCSLVGSSNNQLQSKYATMPSRHVHVLLLLLLQSRRVILPARPEVVNNVQETDACAAAAAAASAAAADRASLYASMPRYL